MDFSMPPKELFRFESADFLQIGKSICMAPKVDVFPFHIIGPHIQPDKFLQGFMLISSKGKFSLALQQSADHRISAFQFFLLGLQLGIFGLAAAKSITMSLSISENCSEMRSGSRQ